jgi:hypothetical protein
MDGMPRQIPIARVAQMFARPSGMFFLDQEGTTWHWGYEERQRVLDPKVPRRLPVPPSTRISVSDHELCHEPKASSGARCTALASLIVQSGVTNDVAWREALPAPLQALTAGAARHCGIAEGKVLCFGAGEAAHPVASSEGARDVAIVGEHACFLDTAGRLHCEPSKGQSAGLSTEGTFQALRSSPHALCALSQAGTPSCFDRELKGAIDEALRMLKEGKYQYTTEPAQDKR